MILKIIHNYFETCSSSMSAVVYVSQEMQAFLGFRREVEDNCVLLGYYTANSGNSLPISGHLICPIFKSKLGSRVPETSSRKYHYWLHNSPEKSNSEHPTCLYNLL
jgi:hypothetical protein